MSSFVFESKPNYYYKVIYKKHTKRISKKEYEKHNKYNGKKSSIKIGDSVEIIIKPYKDGKKVRGKIKKILTNKEIHTRGHKVMLEDGTVGRMVKLF